MNKIVTFIGLLSICWTSFATATDHYSQVLNLEDITKGLSRSRYLVTFDVDYLPPTIFNVYEQTIDDPDMGPLRTVRSLSFGGGPMISVKTVIDRIDANGNKVEPIKTWTDKVSSGTASAPTGTSPFTVQANGQIPALTALPIEDGRFLLSFRSGLSDNIELQKRSNGELHFIRRLHSEAEPLSIIFSLFEKQTRKFTELAALIPPASEDPTRVQCSSPGTSRPLRNLTVEEKTIRRVEYCLPVGNTFERIVLPVRKPLNNNKIDELVNTMTRTSGELARQPLLRVPQDRLSEMNCHGYSLFATLGSRMRLPEGATWIEGLEPAFGMEGTNPFATFLKIHFNKIKTYYEYDEAKVLRDPQVHAGDVIVFTRGPQNALHSATVVPKPNSAELWLEHKVEEGPVVNTPLENIHSLYPYTNMEIYRLRGR